VGVDDELAAEFDNRSGTAFVTMTNAFDAGVTLAISRSNQGKELAAQASARIAELEAQLRELLGVIGAHDIRLESCDRDGNTYCDCLERAIAKLKAK
jgi:hypothetical protein